MSTADLRREYTLHGLNEADVKADPVEQFGIWFEEALAANVPDANAMALATTKPDGRPAARIVLLKHFDANGFLFFNHIAGIIQFEIHDGRIFFILYPQHTANVILRIVLPDMFIGTKRCKGITIRR